MPLGDRELSLSDLGLAIGWYASASNESRGQMTMRTALISSSAGPTNPGQVSMGDFYGEISGAAEGLYGIDMDPSVKNRALLAGNKFTEVHKFQFINTGSRFYKIENRWQNYKKQKIGNFYWKIEEGFANSLSYIQFSGSIDNQDATPPYWGNTHQTASCLMVKIGPTHPSNIYDCTITGYYHDYYNTGDWSATSKAHYSQSAVTKVFKSAGGGGSG
tara:strand:- start:970 stop:1620 length:651 start_codon:yes stop_codon:yes gene_type:complete